MKNNSRLHNFIYLIALAILAFSAAVANAAEPESDPEITSESVDTFDLYFAGEDDASLGISSASATINQNIFKRTVTRKDDWHITCGWDRSKSEPKIETAPAGYMFCRLRKWQEGNKGGLSVTKLGITQVDFRLSTRGNHNPFDTKGGWQKGWYDILWIKSDVSVPTYVANGCNALIPTPF